MSIILESQALEQIKQAIKSNPKVQKAVLFGSRAKGTAKNGSDIDVAIIGRDVSFKDLCNIRAKIDELDLPYGIDLVNYSTIGNTELKSHIDRVGMVLV